MQTRQILFPEKNKAALVAAQTPPLSPTDVLVKMAYTTISAGTEKANLMGILNVNAAGRGLEDCPPFPRTLGYSGAGIVAAVGENVKSVCPGDPVACSWGVHAAHCVRPEDCVFLLEPDISLSEAALATIAVFPMAAIRKTRLEFGESALVMGLGILGLFAVQLLHIAGAVPIVAADPVEERRALALRLGADFALNPTAPDFAETVKELTGGGANAAIEVTGVGRALDQALDCMARFGRIALLGCTRDPNFTIDYYRKIHFPGITLVGAHTQARPAGESSPGWWTHRDDMNAFFRLLQGRRLHLEEMISEVHSPEDAPEVYERLLRDKNFPIGVQFDWTQLEAYLQ